MSYTITLPGGQVKNYERLNAAIEFANKQAKELAEELEVVDEDNRVAHVATYVDGRTFHPWERVETPKFAAPHFEGFRPAYTRKRIEAVVYRGVDERSWLVFDGRTGGQKIVATTKLACALTKQMAQGKTL